MIFLLYTSLLYSLSRLTLDQSNATFYFYFFLSSFFFLFELILLWSSWLPIDPNLLRKNNIQRDRIKVKNIVAISNWHEKITLVLLLSN
jgi:hypothetical protein